jgi:hypothetical protein
VGVADVAPMGVAVIPIFEPLEWGKGGLRHARGGIIATAAVEIYATALIVSATAAAALVEFATTAAVADNTTTANQLSLLALALLVVTTATACSTILAVLLLWVLEHSRRGLVANDVREHLNLPLHCIDGRIVVAKALLCGSVSHAKVGNSIGQGGSGCIVLYGVHVVAMLQGWCGRERRNVDGGFPKGTERSKVHCVCQVVTACNPGLIFFHKEACAMYDLNTYVNNVIVGDGLLGEVGKQCSLEQACNKEFESL